jgi:riboflavin kinase/FMN adenylyltransferase
MKLIRGYYPSSRSLSGSVVTLGNFDGIHLGHQQLLKQLIKAGKSLSLPTVVITFEPQPKEFFTKQQAVPRLMRFREKWSALKNEMIDYVYCLRFNQKLADVAADEFVKKILVNQLHAKSVIVGDDFRFGAKRSGDIALLKQLGEHYGFSVIVVPTVTMANSRVSSTRVREALQAGDMTLAAKLLNRNYRLCGKVTHGEKRGRILGFPTANINLHRKLVPLSGVFVVRAYGINKHPYQGVANVGVRPVFNGARILLEVHLFDFHDDIYGRNLEIEFLHKLREEKHFGSIDALVAQIKQDAVDAKNYFLLTK